MNNLLYETKEYVRSELGRAFLNDSRFAHVAESDVWSCIDKALINKRIHRESKKLRVGYPGRAEFELIAHFGSLCPLCHTPVFPNASGPWFTSTSQRLWCRFSSVLTIGRNQPISIPIHEKCTLLAELISELEVCERGNFSEQQAESKIHTIERAIHVLRRRKSVLWEHLYHKDYPTLYRDPSKVPVDLYFATNGIVPENAAADDFIQEAQ